MFLTSETSMEYEEHPKQFSVLKFVSRNLQSDSLKVVVAIDCSVSIR